MGEITLRIKPQIVVGPPVGDGDISATPVETNCSSTWTVTVKAPCYLTISKSSSSVTINCTSHVSFDPDGEQINDDHVYSVEIDGWRSAQENQNTTSDSLTFSTFVVKNGASLSQMVASRDHTSNQC